MNPELHVLDTQEELERKIIGKLLQEPTLVNLHEINSAWFFNPIYVVLATTLIKIRGNFEDFSELAHKTNLTESEIKSLSYSGFEVQNFDKSLEVLRNVYLNHRLQEATKAYAENPTNKNQLALKDRLREVEELGTVDDDGNLLLPKQEIEYRLENEEEQGIKTFSKLDKILGGGLHGGVLLTIGARPSVGKTAYGVNLAIQAMKRNQDMHIDFFTLEMTKRQMLERFISEMTDVNTYKFRNPSLRMSDEEKNRVRRKLDYIRRTGLRIHDKQFTLSSISRMIRRNQHEAKNGYVAVIDYLGLIDAENKEAPRHVQVSEITREMKLLTNELNIPIVLFSQLNRAVESRGGNKPVLSDLRESGSVEQDSNVVGFLYKDDEEESKRYLHIAKNREGRTGTLMYQFHGASMHFEEVE
jgi:replicative DNA helicase